MTASAETADSMSKGLGGFGSTLAAIIPLVNLTAPIAIWLIANQIQLLSLLLLTGAYLPPSVLKILTGNQFTSFSLGSIPVMEIPVLSEPLKILNIEQQDTNLQMMGLNSASSLTSNIMFVISILGLILIHLLTLLIPKCKESLNEDKHMKCCRKFRNSIDSFMGFTVYVRLFVESFQFMLLSSISEMNAMRTTTTENMVSLGFAILVFVV